MVGEHRAFFCGPLLPTRNAMFVAPLGCSICRSWMGTRILNHRPDQAGHRKKMWLAAYRLQVRRGKEDRYPLPPRKVFFYEPFLGEGIIYALAGISGAN